MQQIDCPLCNSSDFAPVAEVHDRLLGIDGHFHMVRCPRCGLYYLNPQPTLAELQHYYPEEYDPYQIVSPDQLPLLRRLSVNYGLRKRCRAVTRYKRSGRLLEIGCANGLFLDAMRQMGDWRLQGVDVNESAVRYAREELALDVFHGQLEDAQFPAESFDAVVMWDVLEHVHQPKETLLEIGRVLKPDGILVFRLPLLDGWDQKFFGHYWAGWDAPRHLTVFSRRTLSRALAQTGFRIERTACIAGSYPVFVLSVRFWVRDYLPPHAQVWTRRILESLPIRLLVAPVFRLLDWFEKSSIVTVSARRVFEVSCMEVAK